MNLKQAGYDAILFDMDGVIIDTKAEVEIFWNEKMDLHGVSIDEDYIEEKLHGRPARFIIAELFPHLTEEERAEMDRECTRYDSMQASYTIIPGVEKILSQLNRNSINFGLVTSALPPKVDVMLKSLSIPPPFHTIVTANKVKKGKPDPECYLLGAENLGVNIKKVLVFEDSVSGVMAADRAGATVVGVNEPKLSEGLKKVGAQFTIRDFTETSFSSDTATLHFENRKRRFHFNKISGK